MTRVYLDGFGSGGVKPDVAKSYTLSDLEFIVLAGEWMTERDWNLSTKTEDAILDIINQVRPDLKAEEMSHLDYKHVVFTYMTWIEKSGLLAKMLKGNGIILHKKINHP